MSFATSVQSFANQSARERRTLTPATVQPYTGTGAAVRDGQPVSVFLSAVRAERELIENGFIVVNKAELRVLKTCRWQPSEGVEFVNTSNSDRFRCRTATGADSDFAAEIVCEVVKL